MALDRYTELGSEPHPKRDIYRERDGRLKADAIRAFENHVIRDRTERGYFIAERHKDGGWDQNMCAEIFLGFCNFIYVGGDINGLVFGHGPFDIRRRIAWIGGTTDVSYYVRQKACIGMGGRGDPVSEVWDQAFAVDAVRYRVSQHLNDDDDSENAKHPLVVAVEEVLEYPPESRDLFFDALYTAIPARYDGFMDEFYDVGMVTAHRVYYCWAAVRKLHYLLLEEEKADERTQTAVPA